MLILIKSTSSKLLKLKKWLTLPNAAKHLSNVCNEEITEADILRLALDGHLKLSVNFVNQTVARRGNIVGYEDVKWGEFPSDLRGRAPNLPVEEKGESLRYMESLKIDDTRFLNCDDVMTRIEGVWDLPMIGCGRLDVENKYHRLTGGPEVAFPLLEGPVVVGSDGVFYQVGKNCYDNLCYGPRTKAQIVKIKRLELSKSNNKRKEKLLASRKERLQVDKNIEFRNGYGRFVMGHGLPGDSVLVLRTEVLREFEQLMFDNDTGKNTATKVHGNAERYAANREQVLGAAFAVLAKWPEECRDTKGDPVASKIASMIDTKAKLFWPDAQPPLATDSIAEHLREWIMKANSRTK